LIARESYEWIVEGEPPIGGVKRREEIGRKKQMVLFLMLFKQFN
jgi:hypothetical protein